MCKCMDCIRNVKSVIVHKKYKFIHVELLLTAMQPINCYWQEGIIMLH